MSETDQRRAASDITPNVTKSQAVQTATAPKAQAQAAQPAPKPVEQAAHICPYCPFGGRLPAARPHAGLQGAEADAARLRRDKLQHGRGLAPAPRLDFEVDYGLDRPQASALQSRELPRRAEGARRRGPPRRQSGHGGAAGRAGPRHLVPGLRPRHLRHPSPSSRRSRPRPRSPPPARATTGCSATCRPTRRRSRQKEDVAGQILSTRTTARAGSAARPLKVDYGLVRPAGQRPGDRRELRARRRRGR